MRSLENPPRRVAARRSGGPLRRAHRRTPVCEPMDDRLLLSPTPRPHRWRRSPATPSLDVLSLTSTTPTGYSPAEIRAAYGVEHDHVLERHRFRRWPGETIAIVNADSDPDIAADLATFDAEYGLSSPPSFTVNNLGATATDSSWAVEQRWMSWRSAIAPGPASSWSRRRRPASTPSSGRSSTPATCRAWVWSR